MHGRWARAALPSLLLLGGVLCLDAAPDEIPLTPAERDDFRSTPSLDETLDYLRGLATRWDGIRLESFGRSAAGRDMPLVLVARDGAFDPARAHAAGRAVVLIQNGIHAGEIDGKDACLMLLRDLAAGRHRELLDGVLLAIVPIYNVDGHERVSPYNRPNQNGPERGMGFRTTADGHDLNRDHLKLETPEARALVALASRLSADLHVDDHVTNGVDHGWILTYAWAETPQIAAPLDAWLGARMPRVLDAMRRAGHAVGPYVSLVDADEPRSGIDSWVGEPRYSTGYFPLRQVPSILVENHAHRPYRERVLANRDFLLALLQEIAREPRALIAAREAAREQTVRLGRPDASPSQVTLRWKATSTGETVRLPVRSWTKAPSRVTGAPLLRYDGPYEEIEVPWIHRAGVASSVGRPRGYYVTPGWPAIEARLRAHGLRVTTLALPFETELETIRVSRLRPEGSRQGVSYQGLTRVEADVERAPERRALPAGTLWVPADQPDFEIAVQLFEPEAPDSLFAWGLLSIVAERKEWMDTAILERHAERMLTATPGLAAEWERALADPAFAADSGARYRWWFGRTPWQDEAQGLLPVFRALAPAPAEKLGPAWSASPRDVH